MLRYKYIREKREPIQIDYPLSGRTILSGNADNLIRCGGSLVPTDFVYDATEKEERERERERDFASVKRTRLEYIGEERDRSRRVAVEQGARRRRRARGKETADRNGTEA